MVAAVWTAITLEERIARFIIRPAIGIQNTRSLFIVQVHIPQHANFPRHLPGYVCPMNPKYFQFLQLAHFRGAEVEQMQYNVNKSCLEWTTRVQSTHISTYTVPESGLLERSSHRKSCRLPISVRIVPVSPSSGTTSQGASDMSVSSNRKTSSFVKSYKPLGISPNNEFP